MSVEPQPPKPTPLPTWEFAGFWVRLLACAIDALIICIIFYGPVFLLLSMNLLGAKIQLDYVSMDLPDFLKLYKVPLRNICTVILAIYELLMISSSLQATVGKKILGIKVIGREGKRVGIVQSLIRVATKYYLHSIVIALILFSIMHSPFSNAMLMGGVVLSIAVYLINPLMVAFNRKKRGIHDYAAGTAVVRD